tara:strand:- start:178 stop:894 length:717 start_codon:yes stop_codon:yes gene_type:complete
VSGFIDNTSNIDAAEIAAEYRTPEQGVSAKSNSNVAWNDYKRMTPRANQSSNVITTAGSQTMQAQDFGGTAGFTPANRTYQTGSAKGASNVTISGVFTQNAYAAINTGTDQSLATGTFGLGNQGGTSGISLANVASFPSTCTLTGYGVRSSGGLGGGTFFIITNNASGASNWTKVHHRALYPNGIFGNIYNFTLPFDRSDFTYNGNIFNGQEQWSLSVGGFSGVTGPAMNFPFTLEFE